MARVVDHRRRSAGTSLARTLLDPARDGTVVVVTVAGGRTRPFLDPERLAEELDGVAEVHVLATPAASWAFTTALPAHTQVFGGACRTYPPGTTWTRDLGAAPVRYCFPEDDPRAVERLVAADAMAAASHRTRQGTAPSTAQQSTAVVEQVMSEHRALLRLPDGGQAVTSTGLLGYPIPASRLVREGQVVTGTASGTGVLRDFRLARPTDDPGARLRKAAQPGTVALGQVDQVHDTYATVRLHPEVSSQLLIGAVAPGRVRGLRRFLTAGEVLLLSVLSHDPDGTIQCSAVDVPDGATATVDIAVLPGGPPWLTATDTTADEDGDDGDDGDRDHDEAGQPVGSAEAPPASSRASDPSDGSASSPQSSPESSPASHRPEARGHAAPVVDERPEAAGPGPPRRSPGSPLSLARDLRRRRKRPAEDDRPPETGGAAETEPARAAAPHGRRSPPRTDDREGTTPGAADRQQPGEVAATGGDRGTRRTTERADTDLSPDPARDTARAALAEPQPTGPTAAPTASPASGATPGRPSPLDLATRRSSASGSEGAAGRRLTEDLRAVERERDELARELHATLRRLESVEQELRELRPRLRAAVKDADTARQLVVEARAAAAGQGLFDDPTEQFRHEVWLAWLRLVPNPQRGELPLSDYSLGPEFLPSLEITEGIERSKVVEVVVELLTGLAGRKSARAVHALGEGRTSPQQTRHDGAKAWRCYLQSETASARRLHFWRLPGGSIELSRIVLHDDYRP